VPPRRSCAHGAWSRRDERPITRDVSLRGCHGLPARAPARACGGESGGESGSVRTSFTGIKIGVIGYCSGGRQAFLSACSLDIDAAVDCYGAYVVEDPPQGYHMKPLLGLADKLSCPLLGLFRRRGPVPVAGVGGDPGRRTEPPGTRRTSSTASTAPATRSSQPIGPLIGRRRPPRAGGWSSTSSAKP
jgi:Dienelactone hydrolase family